MGRVESLEILAPGPLTTVQDRGRYGYCRYGVPPSGALDSFSLRAGNLIVENSEDEACLEITLMGLRARALTDLTIVVTGADLQPHVNDSPLGMWRTHRIKTGDSILFKGPRSGLRAYLAVGGGISLRPVLGSRSTNLTSRFGGFEGRPLQKGDILFSESAHLDLKGEGRRLAPEWIPLYSKEWILRVVLGPQDDHFKAEGRDAFLQSPFKISSHSDRTGIRLEGPGIQRREGVEASIISEGVVPGSIQIPGDGQPIIILGETVTGGYRKIATVISADLPFLGQIKPGDSVRFKAVSMEEAHQALLEMEERIRNIKKGV